VEARATNLGPVQIPVIIREGQTTVVYLDGVNGPLASWQVSETSWVRQPNGFIVGWRDNANAR